jgi:hypothetical protein
MKKNLKNLFSEDVQKILTDETISAIESAVEDKVDLAVESALLEQDELYAEKLQNLVGAIDKDHTNKMRRIVESVDKDRTAKLVKVIKKYERDQNVDLKKFKKQLVESVSSYLDVFLEESLPKKDLEIAVKNKTAYSVLENLRKVLAIDSAVMKESISSAITEGKNELDKLRSDNDKLRKDLLTIKEQKENSDKRLFIESKVSTFSDSKKKFISKALSDKSLEFIKENFDYTVRLFDNQERKTRETIKEQALKDRKHKPDFVKNEKLLSEKINTDVDNESDPYVEEMKRKRF